MSLVVRSIKLLSVVGVLFSHSANVNASRYEDPSNFKDIIGQLSARNSKAAFSEDGLPAVLIGPKVAVCSASLVGKINLYDRYDNRNKIKFHDEQRIITNFKLFPNSAGVGNQLALLLLDQPIHNVHTASIFGFADGENYDDIIGKWGTAYSRAPIYAANGKQQLFPNDKATHLSRIHLGIKNGNIIKVGLPAERPGGSFQSNEVEDHRKAVPHQDDLGSPVYYFHKGILRLVGLVTHAHALNELNRMNQTADYTLFGAHKDFILAQLQFVATHGYFEQAPGAAVPAAPKLVAAVPAVKPALELWRQLVPKGAGYKAGVDSSESCCETFLKNLPKNVPNELRALKHIVEGRIQENVYRKEVQVYWKNVLANINKTEQGWSTIGRDFLNELWTELSPERFNRCLGNEWSQVRSQTEFSSILALLKEFHKLNEKRKVFTLMEWRFHILPNIRSGLQWIDEINQQGLKADFDEVLRKVPANPNEIRRNVQAFRLPVVEVSKYMRQFFDMLLDYKQSVAPGITESCMINMNLRGLDTPRFPWLMDIVDTSKGFRDVPATFHLDGSIYTWSGSFTPIIFPETLRFFSNCFMNSYKAFKNANKLDVFFNTVVANQQLGWCMNVRSRDLVDAYMQQLPKLIAAQQLQDVKVQAGQKVEIERVKIIHDFLQAVEMGNGPAGADVEDDNLHKYLIERYNANKPGQEVRGANGPITEAVVKQAIREYVDVVYRGNLEMAGIKPHVYKWAKQ